MNCIFFSLFFRPKHYSTKWLGTKTNMPFVALSWVQEASLRKVQNNWPCQDPEACPRQTKERKLPTASRCKLKMGVTHISVIFSGPPYEGWAACRCKNWQQAWLPRQQKATSVLRTQHKTNKKSISVPRGKGSITNGYPKTKFTGQSEILLSSIVQATVSRDPDKNSHLVPASPCFLRIPSAGSGEVPSVLPETSGVEK